MKMAKTLVILLIAGLLLMSCGGYPDNPQAVAEKFLTAFKEMNFEEATKYATEDTQETLTMMESFISMANEEDLEKSKNAKLEIVGTEINGDTAVTTYKMDGEESTIEVKKIEGQWKAHMPKEM